MHIDQSGYSMYMVLHDAYHTFQYYTLVYALYDNVASVCHGCLHTLAYTLRTVYAHVCMHTWHVCKTLRIQCTCMCQRCTYVHVGPCM